MRYILNANYQLRGWEKLPYAIVDTKNDEVIFLDEFTFDTLNLCNGKIDFSSPLISEGMRKTASDLEEEGLVRKSEGTDILTENQKYRFYDNRFMKHIHWSITGRCNCRCKHCYMSAPDAKFGELSHDDIFKIIDEMESCGIISCSLTGGEALVRDDFEEIISTIVSKGINITQIYSNGLLVNQSLLNLLDKYDIHPEINMSFDGSGSHDWLRGINGAENAVRNAFLLCKDRGFPTGAEMCIWKGNETKLKETIHDLAEMGCNSVKITPVTDTGLWKDNGYGEDYSLTAEEIFQTYFDYLDDFYAELPQIAVQLGGFFFADGRYPLNYQLPMIHNADNPLRTSICLHARSNMYISAEGRALTCMGLSGMSEDFQSVYPLVQEVGLKKCLTDSRYMELINTRVEAVIEHNDQCKNCEYKDICLGGCRASAMADGNEDILLADRMACLFFRGGWADRIHDKVLRLHPDAVCL